MDDFLDVRKPNFIEGLGRLFRAFNRTASMGLLEKKSEDLMKFMPELKSAEILPFFERVIMSGDSLPSDKRLNDLYLAFKYPAVEVYHDEARVWTREDGERLLEVCQRLTDKHPGFAPLWRTINPFSNELPSKEWIRELRIQLSQAYPCFQRKMSLR